MSHMIFNKTVNNFFRFSIERGDGSHARQLLDKSALSDPLKKQILELIANVPVSADKRGELDKLLGSDISFDQRKPAKIPTSGMHSLNPETAPCDRLDRALRVQFLSFLDCLSLAQAQRVNSNWQRDAMDGACLQLRDQTSIAFVPDIRLAIPHFKFLHLDHPIKCMKYYDHIQNICGQLKGLERACVEWNLMEHWKHPASVQHFKIWILPDNVKLQLSRFPSLISLSLVVADRGRTSWVPSVFESCATTLQHLTLSSKGLDASPETVTRALEAISIFSQLRSLDLALAHLTSQEVMWSTNNVLSTVLIKIFSSNTHLINLSLADLYENVGGRLGLQDSEVEIFRGASRNLTRLILDVSAPIIDYINNRMFSMEGMQNLAEIFPRLTFLWLRFSGEKERENPLVIPFEGAGVLSRAWPDLQELKINGVWSIDNLDMIMAGHPRLQTLSLVHAGDPEEYCYYWRDDSVNRIINTIVKYGKAHLRKLGLAGIGCSPKALAPLLTNCTYLQSLALSQKDLKPSDMPDILALRAQFPYVYIQIEQVPKALS